MLKSKVVSSALSMVLVLSLSPAAAFAAQREDLGAARFADAAALSVQPMAMKKVRVVSTEKAYNVNSNGKETLVWQLSFSYSKGLLKKEVTRYKNSKRYVRSWTYKNNDIVKVKSGNSALSFELDSKGRKVSGAYKSSSSENKETYSYSAGKLVKITNVGYEKIGSSMSYVQTWKYGLTYKNGLPVKFSGKNEYGYKIVDKFRYDARKNMTNAKESSDALGVFTKRYTNTYDKSGLLVQRQMAKYFQESPSDEAIQQQGRRFKYTYKTVKVPTKLVSKVKAQQWALLNWNVNYALGGISL